MKEKATGLRFTSFYWEERLIWLSLYILFSQWTIALKPYWYEETIDMTQLMLKIMLVVGLLLPRRQVIRILVGVITVFWSVYTVLVDYHYWLSASYQTGFAMRIAQYHPYIWLVGLIWVTYEIFMKQVKVGGHILFLLALQLILFGILDSFTLDVLWDQVAWIILGSLMWLIAVHFKRVRLRYPSSSNRSGRYAAQMIMSAVVLVSAIITIGISVPSLEPVLDDPYTSWIRSAKSGAGSSNTSGKGVANSAVSSGYSLYDTDLGGGFQMDYSSVMTVRSDYRGYWRGETKSNYEGTGWIDAAPLLQLNNPEPGEVLMNDTMRSSNVTVRKVKQTFTMSSERVYPVLFGIHSITSYDELEEGNEGTVTWIPSDGELKYGDLSTSTYPATYTIVSEVIEATAEQLHEATKVKKYSSDSMQWTPYLQLPNNYSARVKELAEKITEGATSDYDRAKLIESYLRSEFTYTNQPDLSKKISPDFVDSFLFEVQEGYCDYYSSSMAVMLRTLGIPTRWVKGYAPGVRDIPRESMPQELYERYMDPNEGGSFRVTNADAHSWVEVYMGDYGWVSFEPTPGFSMPQLEPQQEEDADTPELSQPLNTNDELNQKDESSLTIPGWLSIAAKLVLAIAAGAAIVYLFLRWRAIGFSMRRLQMMRRNLTPNQRMVLETELWLSYLRLKQFRRTPNETVRESVDRWFEDDQLKLQDARSIVAQYELAKYGAGDLADESYKQIKEEIRLFKRKKK